MLKLSENSPQIAEPEEVEATVVRAQRQRPPVNPEAPILTKTGYYTVPPVKRLKRMTNQQLKVQPCLSASPLQSTF